MPTLAINGVDLSYQMVGTGDPLLLVHGFTGSSLDWADVATQLATDNTLVTYDHRGHGESTNTGHAATYTIAQLVDDLDELIQRLGLDGIHLLGHSMGGMVAMRYALRRPEQLASLVLMDTAASGLGRGNAFFDQASEMARTGGLMAVYEMLERFLPSDERGLELRRRTRIKYEQMDPQAFVAFAAELRSIPSVLDDLRQLNLPTTVLVGHNDTPFRAPSDAMAAAIPGARLVVQAGAGHCPQEDDPTTWMATMHEHLQHATIAR